MSDDNYELGSMDISEHTRTWNSFMQIATYGTVLTFVTVLLLLVIFG